MNSVGIDLHRRRSHVAVIDEEGTEVISRRIENDPATFLQLLAELEGETEIALEATYGWEWLADLLQEAGYELHLAHPLRTKAIAAARVKTDSVDARTLAQLLRADLLPEAYVAPRELRDLRDLLRHRIALTQMRSALKNRVHATLARHGVKHGHSDLFGRAGAAFLEELSLREPPRRRLASLLALLAAFDREIAQTTREIRRSCQGGRAGRRAHPDPRRWPLHGDAGDRRGRRRREVPDGQKALRLGRADAHHPLLRRQGAAWPHHPPGVAGAALGPG
jgi:transposase